MKICAAFTIINLVRGFPAEFIKSSEKCLRRVEKIRHMPSNRSFSSDYCLVCACERAKGSVKNSM